jgi:hypothetical protein
MGRNREGHFGAPVRHASARHALDGDFPRITGADFRAAAIRFRMLIAAAMG